MNLLLTQGNAVNIPLADESVHCVVTSPPYWGLRDYGVGDQLGLEPTPEQYIENMVAVFREVRRVLRKDGTVWLNLGDSYATQPAGNKTPSGFIQNRPSRLGKLEEYNSHGGDYRSAGLKPKDLCGIPWRVAFALQADGWWLRSDIIWSKPNPMPESVTDRPTKAHEYLFLLTKSARYYYDADAVREPHAPASIERAKNPNFGTARQIGDDNNAANMNFYLQEKGIHLSSGGRNRRTVWHIATAPYSGAHFATYPPALVEPCIKAGTSERGVCPECGAPWERVVERVGSKSYRTGKSAEKASVGLVTAFSGYEDGSSAPTFNTLGWRPTCHCCEPLPNGIDTIPFKPIPATVFDPFAGSGTTLQVARALGRSGVGLDLSAEYLHLARERLSLDALDAWTEGAKKDGQPVEDLPLFGGGV